MSPKWHKYQWIAQMLILNFLQFCKSNRKRIVYAGKYSTYITWGTYIAQGLATNWELKSILKGDFYLLNNSPAWHDDFTSLTGWTVFHALD